MGNFEGMCGVLGALAHRDISAEVNDLRCLVPLEMEPLIASAKITGRVLIVEGDNLTGSWGAEIAARLSEAAVAEKERWLASPPDYPRGWGMWVISEGRKQG